MSFARSGLFLDLDGTLADSLSVMRTAYHAFLSQCGRSGSDAEFVSLNGPPLSEIVDVLAATHGLSFSHEQLLAAYKRLIRDAYLDVAPDEAAGDLLRTARRLGFKVAVVTSNSAELATAWLARVGLMAMVDAVVGGDEVGQGKPNPEPYLLALRRSDCDPAASFAVEDSLMGAQASVSAGIPTFLLSDSPGGPPDGVVVVGRLGDVTDFLTKRY